MAVQSIFYTIDGETKTYPSTKHIATKAHMAIRLQLISDDTYTLIDVTAYELINNAAVLVEAPNPKIYKQLEVRVADNPDELDTGLNDIAIVASIADEVVIVANNVEDVTNFSDVYLGARSSNPSTRTDGSALEAGDLYFNTTDNSMYVYTGSAWVSSVITDHSQLTSIGTNTHAEIDTYIAAIRTIAQGGTGSATAAGARTNLGLAIGTDVEAYDADNAKTDVEQNYTAPQYATSHDYGTVGATKTIVMDDGGGNLKMTTTAATPLTLTASNFQVDQTGVILIVNTEAETISFDSTFSGNDAQDLSAAGTYRIGYVSEAATVTLSTAILV